MVSSGDYTGTSDFCHLNVHTVFSPLIGVASPDNYAKQCKRNGQLAIAATEHGNMASVPDMHFACKKNGIKYIPGCELHWNDYEPERKKHYTEGLNDLKRTNEDLFTRIMRNRTLTVLCKNDVGFHNLVKLTTLATKHGFFHMPRVWFEELVKYKEGLIILSGGMNGPIAHELYLDIDGKEIEGARHDRSNISKTDGSKLDLSAVGYSKKFKKEFGDDFYIEIQMPCMPEIYDNKIFRAQILLADKLGIQLVLTNSCYYLNSEDIEIQRIMVAIAQKTHIDDPNLVFRDTDQQWLKSRAELWATFKNNKYSTNVSDETFETICDNTLKGSTKVRGVKARYVSKDTGLGCYRKGRRCRSDVA
jgi:DNA polymerase-3 subunit alpha